MTFIRVLFCQTHFTLFVAILTTASVFFLIYVTTL